MRDANGEKPDPRAAIADRIHKGIVMALFLVLNDAHPRGGKFLRVGLNCRPAALAGLPLLIVNRRRDAEFAVEQRQVKLKRLLEH